MKAIRQGEVYYQREDITDYGELRLIKKKPKQVDQPEVQHFAPLESKILGKLVGLIHHCAAVRYEDGDLRETGNFTVSTSGPSWVVCVNDRDSGKRLRVLAPTLDAALAQACMLVETPDAPWEDAPWLHEGSSKKRRK